MNRVTNDVGSNTIVAPDLSSPRFKADPYPFYARLRAEAPVWRTTLPDKRSAWLVTRYEDVARVLKDDTFAKDKLNAMDPGQQAKTPWVPGFLKPLERNMLDLDDPDHARLRALVSKAFTPASSKCCGGGSRHSAKGSSMRWDANGGARAGPSWSPTTRCPCPPP